MTAEQVTPELLDEFYCAATRDSNVQPLSLVRNTFINHVDDSDDSVFDFNLSERKLKPEDLRPLMRTLLRSPKGFILRLSRNVMNDKCTGELTKFLQQGTHIRELYLDTCHLSDGNAARIADALHSGSTPTAPELTVLDFTTNDLGGQFAEAMARTFNILGARFQLEVLRLGSNNIQRHVVELVQNLQYNLSLSTLDLTANGVGTTSFRAIASALKSNHSLTELILKHNKLSAGKLTELDRIIADNATARQQRSSSRGKLPRDLQMLEDTRKEELRLETELNLQISRTPDTRRMLKELDSDDAGIPREPRELDHTRPQAEAGRPPRGREERRWHEFEYVEPVDGSDEDAAEDRHVVASAALSVLNALAHGGRDVAPDPTPVIDYEGIMSEIAETTEAPLTFSNGVPRLVYEEILGHAATSVRTLLSDGRKTIPEDGAVFLVQLLGELGTRCRAYEERMTRYVGQLKGELSRLESENGMLREQAQLMGLGEQR
ncbi:hypothetical protein J8273_4695 [Carpediemonas membranifera]|uniref:Uncharacterized protein n=1 Tax=Carpediemonas membranifera TaxID=201153 RepID=A0A8J6E3Z8_9EUKA|nr:hypothetical protein J8273_4695 [Carpediemonas membranifera]|eukprot:KAG9393832.1 hypothetical protein J8273_4695 [Carpediemonas membranifera]